jgi:uncharacterized protein (TIGR02145 family)
MKKFKNKQSHFILTTIFLVLYLLMSKNSNAQQSPCVGIPQFSKQNISVKCNKYVVTLLRSNFSAPCNGYTLEIFEIVNGVLNQNPVHSEVKVNGSSIWALTVIFSPQFTISPNKVYQFNLRYKCCGFESVNIILDTPSNNLCNTAPVLLPATDVHCNKAKISWNTKCPNAKLSVWYRSANSNPFSKKVFVVNNLDVKNVNSYVINNLTHNRIYYYQLSLSNGCNPTSTFKSSTLIFVANGIVPQADAGKDTTVDCVSNLKLFAKLPVGYTGNWTIINPSLGADGSFEDAKKPNSNFTFGIATTYTLRWTITGTCGTSSKDIIVSNAFVCGSNYTDTRNGKVYPTTLLNGKCWFGKSLNYGSMINWNGATNYGTTTQDAPWPFPTTGGSIVKYCADNDTAKCNTHGALYLGDVAAASDLCPPCWHVASISEWEGLFTFAGHYYIRGSRLSGMSPFAFNGISSLPNNPNKELETGFTGFNGMFGCRNGTPFYNGTPASNANMNGCWDNRPDGDYNVYWTSTQSVNSGYPDVGYWPTRYNQTRGGVAHFVYFVRLPIMYGTTPSTTIYAAQGIKHRRDAAYHIRCVRN